MTKRTKSTAIVLFAKKPEAGRVKTRLAADIGAERAVEIYKRMVDDTVSRAEAVEDADTWLYFSPTEAEAYMREWQSDLFYAPQSNGDLGDRMLAAFDGCATQGYASTIVIGTDCPGLNTKVLEEATAALRGGADLVLGPTFDGGYYLIASKRPIPELFNDMPWSTEVVFEQTLHRARTLELDVTCLEQLHDVDTQADLAAYGIMK
jgi:rSAM/selenodomain-associated transferase 1